MDAKTNLDNAFAGVLSKRSLLLLALFWGSSLFLFVSYGTVSGRLRADRHGATIALPQLAENETGRFSVWRKKGAGGSLASCKVAFDNLTAENHSSGVFRTASHKRVHIENVHVTFLTTPGAGEHVRWRDFYELFAPQKRDRSAGGQLGVFDEVAQRGSDLSVSVDLANATEVRIRDLDWRICAGDATQLRVQCRSARFRADSARVVLQGRVIVWTPDAVLESNRMEMDVQHECFVIDGRYLLTRGEQKERGEWGRFDATLKLCSTESSDTGENGPWANGLPLGVF